MGDRGHHRGRELYPGRFLIGSNGGGGAVALRPSSDGQVGFVLVPFIGNSKEDAIPGGRTLAEFLDSYRSGRIWKSRSAPRP